MNITDANSNYLKFRKSPLPFQCTFKSPLKDLERFVGVFDSVFTEISSGQAYISSIVFEPKKTNSMLSHHGLLERLKPGCTVEAISNQECSTLLETLLSDWVDFLYIPSPRKYVVFADHDEFCTFYCAKKGGVSKIAAALKDKGYGEVSEFKREL